MHSGPNTNTTQNTTNNSKVDPSRISRPALKKYGSKFEVRRNTQAKGTAQFKIPSSLFGRPKSNPCHGSIGQLPAGCMTPTSHSSRWHSSSRERRFAEGRENHRFAPSAPSRPPSPPPPLSFHLRQRAPGKRPSVRTMSVVHPAGQPASASCSGRAANTRQQQTRAEAPTATLQHNEGGEIKKARVPSFPQRFVCMLFSTLFLFCCFGCWVIFVFSPLFSQNHSPLHRPAGKGGNSVHAPETHASKKIARLVGKKKKEKIYTLAHTGYLSPGRFWREQDSSTTTFLSLKGEQRKRAGWRPLLRLRFWLVLWTKSGR